MYDFRVKPELTWAVVVAVATVVGEALIALDPATIADWQTWALGVLTGSARAGIAVFIAMLTKPSTR